MGVGEYCFHGVCPSIYYVLVHAWVGVGVRGGGSGKGYLISTAH